MRAATGRGRPDAQPLHGRAEESHARRNPAMPRNSGRPSCECRHTIADVGRRALTPRTRCQLMISMPPTIGGCFREIITTALAEAGILPFAVFASPRCALRRVARAALVMAFAQHRLDVLEEAPIRRQQFAENTDQEEHTGQREQDRGEDQGLQVARATVGPASRPESADRSMWRAQRRRRTAGRKSGRGDRGNSTAAWSARNERHIRSYC